MMIIGMTIIVIDVLNRSAAFTTEVNGKYNPNIVWNEAHKANMLQRLRETIEEHNASKKDDKMLKKVL